MNQLQSWYQTQPKALRALLTINVVIYVVWFLVLGRIPVVATFVWEHLALNPALPDLLFEPWQLLTYNFLHLDLGLNGFLHILFNMLWMVWIGREYEEMHGPHQLLGVYILAGLGGGLLTMLLSPLLPVFFANAVHGASASVLGIAMAVAITYPYKKIGLFILGTFRLIHLVLAVLVIDIFILLFGDSQTAVAAHFGGALAGFLIASGEQRGMDLTGWAHIFLPDLRERRDRRTAAPRGGLLDRLEAWLSKGKTPDEKPADEDAPRRRAARSRHVPTEDQPAATTEVDRILEKISEQGMDALTEEERRVLYEASQR